MLIIPKNVREKTHPVLLEAAIKYCEIENATEIYNVTYLGEGDYRIMYYKGESSKDKMVAVILKTPFI